MSTFQHCKVWIDLGDGWAHWPAGEAEYTAHFDYSPGRPGVHTLRNGDPGYPDDPPELYVTDLERNNCSLPLSKDNGESLLTDEQYESIERQVGDWICEQEAMALEGEYEHFRHHLLHPGEEA